LQPNFIALLESLTSININSGHIPINRGVLQGSLLSPFLFNIHINDLIALLNRRGIYTLAYADDIVCICDNFRSTNCAINLIQSWCLDNKTMLNEKKSEIMKTSIQAKRTRKNFTSLQNISLVNSYKYLGIILTDNLHTNLHLNNLQRI